MLYYSIISNTIIQLILTIMSDFGQQKSTSKLVLSWLLKQDSNL